MAKLAGHSFFACLPDTVHCAVVGELSETAYQTANMISAGVAAAQGVYRRMDFLPPHNLVLESVWERPERWAESA